MYSVLTHSSLVHCLSNLPIRSYTQQLKLWDSQKRLHQRTTSLISSLGKPSVTAAQAKKLDSVGLSFSSLLCLHHEAVDVDTFSQALRSKGVNSKALQAKLWKLLGSKPKPKP